MNFELTRREILCLVGLSFFCVMLKPPFFSMHIPATLPCMELLRPSFDAGMVVLGALLAVLCYKRPTVRWISFGPFVFVLGALASIGPIAIDAGVYCGVSAPWYYLVAVIAMSAGFTGVAAGWFSQLASLPRKRILVIPMAAFLLSHLSGLVELSPVRMQLVFSSLVPLASLAFLFACRREYSAEIAGRESVDQVEPCRDSSDLGRRFRWMRLFALGLIFSEVLCGSFLRCCWARGGLTYSPTDLTFRTYFVSALIGLAFLLIMSRSRTASLGALMVGGVGLAGIVTATTCLTVLPVQVLAPFVTGLYSALMVCMLSLIALWRADGDRSSGTCAGTFVFLYALTYGLTFTVVPAALAGQGGMQPENFAFMGIAVGMLVSAGISAVLLAVMLSKGPMSEYMSLIEVDSPNDLREAALVAAQPPAVAAQPLPSEGPLPTKEFSSPVQPLSSEQPSASDAQDPKPTPNYEDALDALAARYGLTERERQTAALMARGYTVKRVAEELTVAPSTVQSYCKSIYRKMDIHRKDELIELVSAAAS